MSDYSRYKRLSLPPCRMRSNGRSGDSLQGWVRSTEATRVGIPLLRGLCSAGASASSMAGEATATNLSGGGLRPASTHSARSALLRRLRRADQGRREKGNIPRLEGSASGHTGDRTCAPRPQGVSQLAADPRGIRTTSGRSGWPLRQPRMPHNGAGRARMARRS